MDPDRTDGDRLLSAVKVTEAADLAAHLVELVRLFFESDGSAASDATSRSPDFSRLPAWLRSSLAT